MKFRPLSDNILVKPLESEEKTKSGIVLPDSAKEKPQQGKVLAVGPGKIEKGERAPIDIKVSDTIVFGRYSGDEIKVEGEELKIVKLDDVLGVVEE